MSGEEKDERLPQLLAQSEIIREAVFLLQAEKDDLRLGSACRGGKEGQDKTLPTSQC